MLPRPSYGQDAAPQVWAITHARIVTGTGGVISAGTVVLRDGLIAAVGAGLPVPPDARVIDGTGLTVYPGLINALSSVGMPGSGGGTGGGRGGGAVSAAAAAGQDPAAALNSTQRPGLRPELLASEILQLSDAGIATLRAAGFTSALTAGRSGGGIFLGKSALISLDALTVDQAIIRSPVALHMGFTTPGGGYPVSLLGVFAFIRQILLDAQHYRELTSLYERNPLGIRRPAFDPSLAALQPVISGEMPVVMYANTRREILRALDLADEFRLRVIIGGGAEAFKVVDEIRAANAAVFLTTDLPRRTTPVPADSEPEALDVLRDRIDAPRGAARLQQAGVRFAFHAGSSDEMLGNIARMIAEGLTADQALKALTSTPAELLGQGDRLGTIETGRIANLTITEGDLFAQGSRIKWVVIDGKPSAIATPTTVAARDRGRVGAEPTRSVAGTATGTWSVSITMGTGQESATLILSQDGERLTGSVESELGRNEIVDGRVNSGGDFHFRVTQGTGAQVFEGIFDGRISGDSMTGTVQISGTGATPFSGTRRPQPDPGVYPAGTAHRTAAWPVAENGGRR
jgi:imidazolonepropionase-like amidohydrolase